MDLVEVLSNLHALRQLYELLQNIEDDLQHINSKNVHQTLDLRARKLFKHLLDDATEKMFHTDLKIIEAQSVVENTPCSSQIEQQRGMPKLQSPLSPDTVKASQDVVMSNEKDFKSNMITSEKDEHYPVKCESAVSGSIVSTLSDAPQYKKKRCRACIAKELKKQYSTKEATVSNARTEVPARTRQDLDQHHDRASDSVSCVDEHAKRLQKSNSKTIGRENSIDGTHLSSVSLTSSSVKQEVGYIPTGEMKKNLDEGDHFTEVLTNAIRQIESSILALKLSSDLAHSSINNNGDEHVPFKLNISVSHVDEYRKEEAVTREEMNQTEMGESSLGKGTQFTQLSQKHGKSAESVPGGQDSTGEFYMKRFGSLNHSSSENNNMMPHYADGPRVSPSNEVTMKPLQQLKTVATPVQTSETSLLQNRTARKGVSSYNSSMLPQSMGSTISPVGGGLGKNTSQTRRLKTAMMHDQTMLRPVFLDYDMPSKRTRARKMSHVGSGRRIMPRQEESEEEDDSSISRSHSSSTWTSYRNESSGSSRSNYSDESWSPRNGDSSETETNSQVSISSYHSSEEDSRLSDSVESDYSHKKYLEKSIGRLRKTKNMLGLIFHHHHHHHHHHHRGNNGSTWKNVRNMFHHKDKHGRNDHGQAEGVKKSLAVKNRSNKNKGGNFHALVKGLMRHVKHSKKSKGGIRPRQPPGLNKRKVKLPWWQTSRGGGVKLPNRGRVKVGFPNKRPKLPMKR